MSILAVVSLSALVLALFFLAKTLHSLRHRRLLRAGGSCLGACCSGALGGAAVVLLVSVYSYGRLVEEQRVSTVVFRQVAPQEYEARVLIEGERDRVFVLHGDEWQIDARIVTWSPPMTILGLDPLYRLDRISGRYADIDSERTASRTVHSLAPSLPVDIWQAARRFPLLTPGVDAYYGTATYVPMADGARFDVSLSRDALIARPANSEAEIAVGNWSH